MSAEPTPNKAKAKSKSKSKAPNRSPLEREGEGEGEGLAPHQQRALDQLRELTNGADDEVSTAVLRSVEWDVQRATELIFESSSQAPEPTSTLPKARPTGTSLHSSSSTGSLSSLGSTFGHNGGSSSSRPTILPFEIDDSSQTQPGTGTGSGWGGAAGLALARPLMTLVAFPFHLLSTLVRFIFGVLRVPLPRLPGGLGFVRFTGLGLFGSSGSGRRRRGDGRAGYGEPWVREVEEETGAVWLGRVVRGGYAEDGVGSGVQAGAGSGEGAVRRGGRVEVDWGKGKKYLPDFEVCGYEAFLRMCAAEKKVGCVVLVSEEHDDVLGFKRGALVDQGLVRRMHEAGVVCWGGDVRDREVWTAAEKLQATTYPFVAFIALQPRRGINVLMVLSRHQGKSATSGPTLTSHLDTNVLPRVLPFLNTLSHEEKGRERDRALRAEQDRAYEESRRRDREKWEREQRERVMEERERARREGEERERVERERRRVEIRRRVWGVVGAWRDEGKKEGEVRVVIRMPGGERVVEKFSRDDSVSVLYAVVDRLLAGTGDVKAEEMNVGELDALIGREGGKHFWGFKIVSAYPRKEIEWREGVEIGDVDALVGGGQVVVETGAPAAAANGNGDDGCETEEEE